MGTITANFIKPRALINLLLQISSAGGRVITRAAAGSRRQPGPGPAPGPAPPRVPRPPQARRQHRRVPRAASGLGPPAARRRRARGAPGTPRCCGAARGLRRGRGCPQPCGRGAKASACAPLVRRGGAAGSSCSVRAESRPLCPRLSQGTALPFRLPWANRGVLLSALPASPRPLLENAVSSHPGQRPGVSLPGRALQDWTRSSSGHWAPAVSAQPFSPTNTRLFLRISLAMCVPSNIYTDDAWHNTSTQHFTQHSLLFTDEE